MDTKLEGKVVLITGGTGSFGTFFANYLLRTTGARKVVVFSRDEQKQESMSHAFRSEKRIRFLLGDIRDLSRLKRAFEDVDIVVHAAALKIVPTAEYDPFEYVKTNIFGSMNVIEACLDRGVRKAVLISTDKASAPINLYGATKLAAEKMFSAANSYSGPSKCIFASVRYGNVISSRGSIVSRLREDRNLERIQLTDSRMTRFVIRLSQGAEIVMQAISEAKGGEVFVPKIPSISLPNIVSSVLGDVPQRYSGLRAGEKLHEQLISADEASRTVEYEKYYKILSAYDLLATASPLISSDRGKLVSEAFSYTSSNNDWVLSTEEFADLLAKE